MNSTDQLQRIKSRCQELLNQYNGCEGMGTALAVWKSTIAAIDLIVEFRRTKWGWDGDCGLAAYVDSTEQDIIDAWKDELP